MYHLTKFILPTPVCTNYTNTWHFPSVECDKLRVLCECKPFIAIFVLVRLKTVMRKQFEIFCGKVLLCICTY